VRTALLTTPTIYTFLSHNKVVTSKVEAAQLMSLLSVIMSQYAQQTAVCMHVKQHNAELLKSKEHCLTKSTKI